MDNLAEGDSAAEECSVLPTMFLCPVRAGRLMSGFGWVMPAVTLLEPVAGVGRRMRLEDESVSAWVSITLPETFIKAVMSGRSTSTLSSDTILM